MYSPSHFKFVFLISGFVLSLTGSSAFLLTSRSSTGLPTVDDPYRAVQHASVPNTALRVVSSTALRVVLDPPMKGDEKKKGKNDEENSNDWIPSETGGFIPNIRARLGFPKNPVEKSSGSSKEALKVKEVLDILQYKTEVAEVRDQIVCVRFYAPWCKSCKAIEASFRRLPRDFPGVKFVEVPVLKDNAYLHKGLGVPSLPFGHIYHPETGLMEERKISKKFFAEFKQVLRTYVHGECPVQYDDDGNCIPL
jgi:thiol-disulfide isomerase/thioredoxin